MMDDWCKTNADHYTIVWIGDLWERATFVRGMEYLLFEIIENPEFRAFFAPRDCRLYPGFDGDSFHALSIRWYCIE